MITIVIIGYPLEIDQHFSGFGRNKIIALALLCGSDYSNGVEGIGKDSSMKLFEKYSDQEILDRMRSWRTSGHIFEEFEKKLADKNICTSCGHQGKLQSHNKAGKEKNLRKP